MIGGIVFESRMCQQHDRSLHGSTNHLMRVPGNVVFGSAWWLVRVLTHKTCDGMICISRSKSHQRRGPAAAKFNSVYMQTLYPSQPELLAAWNRKCLQVCGCSNTWSKLVSCCNSLKTATLRSPVNLSIIPRWSRYVFWWKRSDSHANKWTWHAHYI